ncbi:DNA (cytosine-5-)-methyltransferase [uncultured Sphaerochaeta sp.]|uniref:DNA (cytosine-5-)-methyltransferase n=1 Tax=uncultured Sphaerochaeta sp. TaxID=886478 RepID=UPI002AA84CE1|nr:DNA (cytosine-5-)-methyltransferase [uncultured Sphaerochaeta sp.]
MKDNSVVELFAGVGGFRLGLEKNGDWKVVWANQWEPGKKNQHAFNCYASHFKDGIHVNDDIGKVKAEEIPTHTLLVGGFPCQDYSVAATGAKGIHGKKGVLWWEIERIVKAKNPRFVLLENVDRLLKSPAKQRGRDFGIMLSCFNQLGYIVEWRVINAADYGFPQRRRRVFIFATKKEDKLDIPYRKASMQDLILRKGFFAQEFPVDDNLAIGEPVQIELSTDLLSMTENFMSCFENAGIMMDGIVHTMRTYPIEHETVKLSDILQKEVCEKYYLSDETMEKWKHMKGSKAEPRKTKAGYEYMFKEGAIPFPDPLDRPSRTMLTSESSKNRSTHVIADPQTGNLRLLTPIECERLNGFPDNWTDTGMPEKFRYFCMGNALVVGLIERMGKRIAYLNN